ncbi:hypothetical protein SGLAM104S_03346 [Streptomyces glaucescens]
MDEYGSDALRFTLARGANPGVDVPIGEDWVQGSRNFANKIWNATRFALMNGATVEGPLPDASEDVLDGTGGSCPRLNSVVAEVDTYYEDYEFARSSPTRCSTSPGTRSSTRTWTVRHLQAGERRPRSASGS